MIQKFTEDDEGNTVIEFDEEGIDFLISGLMQLSEDGPGGLRTAPSLWTRKAPWWRFWNRSGDPVVGEIKLKRVD